MKALSRLQSTILFQAAEHDEVAQKLSARAKQMVTFGVLVAASLASQGAQAQVLTPSRCATVGGSIGGVIGAASGNSNVQNIVYGTLGALGGAVAGNWLCEPKVASQDASYNQAARFGLSDAQANAVSPQVPKVALSINERERLDEMSRAAVEAKYQWKKSLHDIDSARRSGFSAGLNTALERESETRAAFGRSRGEFSAVVAALNAGNASTPPRAVGRYLEISASLLEIGTDKSVSYKMLEERDTLLKQRSKTYKDEADRVGRLRATRS